MAHTAPKPILVGIGDPNSHESALAYAAAEAARERRGLRLVHVMQPVHSSVGPDTMLISFKAAHLVGEQLVHHAAERAVALTHGRVTVEADVRRGPVIATLVELGDASDRVVLQHLAQSRLHRVLTGSVAAGVAGRSSVPVVSVPEAWTPGASGISHVTVGVDGDGSDPEVLGRAFELAAKHHGTLTVLHAWYLPSLYDEAIVDRATLRDWTDRAADRLEASLASGRAQYPDVEARVEIKHMRPADALVEASQHSDLLVLGRSRGRHHLPHLGALTRAVIRESRCPVEVTPVAQEVPRPPTGEPSSAHA